MPFVYLRTSLLKSLCERASVLLGATLRVLASSAQPSSDRISANHRSRPRRLGLSYDSLLSSFPAIDSLGAIYKVAILSVLLTNTRQIDDSVSQKTFLGELY